MRIAPYWYEAACAVCATHTNVRSSDTAGTECLMADASDAKRARVEDRRRRLEAALRENLAKRKAQARARAAAEKSQPARDLEPPGKA
jgi:hypothetical protein